MDSQSLDVLFSFGERLFHHGHVFGHWMDSVAEAVLMTHVAISIMLLSKRYSKRAPVVLHCAVLGRSEAEILPFSTVKVVNFTTHDGDFPEIYLSFSISLELFFTLQPHPTTFISIQVQPFATPPDLGRRQHVKM